MIQYTHNVHIIKQPIEGLLKTRNGSTQSSRLYCNSVAWLLGARSKLIKVLTKC